MRYTHKLKSDPTACLLVEINRTEDRSDYFHVTLKTRRRDVDQYGVSDLRWPDHGYPYNLPYLAGLQVTCQGNNRQPDRDGYPLYAYRVSYSGIGDIEADEAEAMALTLKRVDTRMQAMDRNEGRVHTFGMYAMRAARALGIAAIVREYSASEGRLTSNRHTAMNPVEGGEWIDRQVEKWRRDMRERYGLETPGAEVA